ncbi:MAG: acyltransferase [Muribaculaceae bacterium]|nr:acyltransferase [Muribaculaceae bacterium]
MGNQALIFGSGIIEIASEVQIAPHCVIVSGNHTSENGSYSKGKLSAGPVVIGKGAWIAANCTVAKNSILPSNSVLAANSFLNKPFEIENSIYGGVPARLIKTNKPFT